MNKNMDKDIELFNMILAIYNNKFIYTNSSKCKKQIIPLDKIILNNLSIKSYELDIPYYIKSIEGTSKEIQVCYEVKEYFYNYSNEISLSQIIKTYHYSIYEWLEKYTINNVYHFVVFLERLIRMLNWPYNIFEEIDNIIFYLNLLFKIILLHNKNNLLYDSSLTLENVDEYILPSICIYGKHYYNLNMNKYLDLIGKENYKKYIFNLSTYVVIQEVDINTILSSFDLIQFTNQEIEKVIVNLMKNNILYDNLYQKLKEINSKYVDEYISKMVMNDLSDIVIKA